MRYRALAAVLALTLLSACGTAGNGSGSAAVSDQPPEEPLVLDTLALEVPSGTDTALARTFAEALPGEMAKYGVEIASVELSFGTSPAATAQALAEGGVDLAFLPAADFLRYGGGRAILADGEAVTLPETEDPTAAVTAAILSPGERAEIVTAPTGYGRKLASRPEPSWEEIAHARWGVLEPGNRAGYRCLDLWLCDYYEDNGIADLPDVTVFESWEDLLRAAAEGDIDALPLGMSVRQDYAALWRLAADRTDEAGRRGLGRRDIQAELPLLAETEGIAAQVAAVREGGGLESPAFALALEASLRALLSPEQCLTLLGAEAFAPVEDTALAPTRRALLSAGTA